MVTKVGIRSIDDPNPLNKKYVNAVRYGNFAVHREAFERNGCRYWNVTHIHSGLLVAWFWNIGTAAELARWLNKQPVNWRSYGSKKDVKRNPVPKHIRDEVNHWMLGEMMPVSVALCREEGWIRQ